MHEFALGKMVRSYERNQTEQYAQEFQYFIDQGTSDEDYPLVYLKAADPEADFSSKDNFKIVEFDPKLETLRKAEYGSI